MKSNRFFLDIGAHDGIELSNTYLLEQQFAWQGICVEANLEIYELLIKNMPGSNCIHACVHSGEGQVKFANNGVHGGDYADSFDIASFERELCLVGK